MKKKLKRSPGREKWEEKELRRLLARLVKYRCASAGKLHSLLGQCLPLPCGLHADILTSVTTFKTHGFGKHAFREYSFLQAMEFGVGGRMKLSWDGEQQITTVIDWFGHTPRDFLGLNAKQ